MFKAIYRERMLEFSCEQIRKQDLIRWGLLEKLARRREGQDEGHARPHDLHVGADGQDLRFQPCRHRRSTTNTTPTARRSSSTASTSARRANRRARARRSTRRRRPTVRSKRSISRTARPPRGVST
ncbi:MAG: RagB/SusD family nutrient uptake outer membrane protein [Alistipes senegalensis]